MNEINLNNLINELRTREETMILFLNTDFSGMFYEDIIDKILSETFEAYKDNLITFSQIKKIVNMFVDFKVYNSAKELFNRVKWLKKFGLLDKNIQLKQSHVEILDTFDRLNVFLNNFDCDYYHTSGILTFLLTETPLVRYHHDLDVFINENDLQKLTDLCKNTDFEVFQYLSKRSDFSKRRTVKLFDKRNKIVISVFLFERLYDNSIVVNDYYIDEFGNFKTDQDYNSSKCVDLSFSKSVFIHNNIPYKAITIEALYNCKKDRGVKHQFDCSILNDYVDLLLEHQIDLERVSIRCFDTIENPVILKQMQEMIKNEQSSCRRLVPTKK